MRVINEQNHPQVYNQHLRVMIIRIDNFPILIY